MRRLLRILPSLGFAIAMVSLAYVGGSLFVESRNDRAWAQREAFAQSVQAGERLVAARNMAGVLRQELAAERDKRDRDRRRAFVAFGAALFALIAGVSPLVLTQPRGLTSA